jgi:hypothetical protein
MRVYRYYIAKTSQGNQNLVRGEENEHMKGDTGLVEI